MSSSSGVLLSTTGRRHAESSSYRLFDLESSGISSGRDDLVSIGGNNVAFKKQYFSCSFCFDVSVCRWVLFSVINSKSVRHITARSFLVIVGFCSAAAGPEYDNGEKVCWWQQIGADKRQSLMLILLTDREKIPQARQWQYTSQTKNATNTQYVGVVTDFFSFQPLHLKVILSFLLHAGYNRAETFRFNSG